MNTEKEAWHLSKSVPISLIATLLLQTVAIVWFLSSLNSDVIKNTEHIADNKDRVVVLEKESRSQENTLTRIETNVNHIKNSVEDLKSAIVSP